MLSADAALVRRIEAANAAIVAGMAQCGPNNSVEPVAGGVAVFAGADSPMTHAIGVGVNGPVSGVELERLEAFFRDRGAPCTIDMPSMADPSLIEFIRTRPYRVAELNYVLAMRLAEPPAVRPEVDLATDIPAWASLVARGFMDTDEPVASVVEMLSLSIPSMIRFTASLDGQPTAGAAMAASDGTAWMFGDATLPRARCRGLQGALIAARLRRACDAGCDVAAASVLPGTASHRNYERAGFRLLYNLVNLRRDW